MIGAPPSPSINPPPSNPSSLLSASPRSPRMALPPMDRTSSTSSAVSMASPSLVTLHLISQFTYPQGISGSPDEDRAPPSVIRAKRSHTIAKIKNAVHVNWPGRPKVEGIRLIYSGRLLSDHETVGQVVPEAQSEAYLHLVVRPDAWLDLDMAPLTPTGPRSGRTTPVPYPSAPSVASARLRPRVDPLEGSSYFLLPSEAAAAAAASSSSISLPPSPTSTTMRPHDVLQMDSLPRVLSMSYALYYQRYALLYGAFEGQSSSDDQGEFQRLYGSLGLASAGARQALSAVEKQVFGWSAWYDDPCPEVATLELLLRECCQRVDELRLMLEQVELARHDSNANAESAVADSHTPSASLQPTPTTAPVQPAAVAAPHNAAAANVQRVAARAPIPLPAPLELFAMFLPAAFLAMKLAILLYIFTRGVSSRKKWTLYTGAYLWIAFEMVRAWRRRNRRLRSLARRAARQAAAASGNGGEPASSRSSRHRTSSRAGQATPASHSTGTGVPVAPRRLTANSPAQPRFWLQRIAFLGMEEEDLELGFRPSSSQAHLWLVRVARERAVAANQGATGAGALRRRLLAKLDLSKTFNDLTFPIVLYLATLIPEVEELRTEEVRKRERLIRKWWKDKGAHWVEKKRKEKADLQEKQQPLGGEGETAGESSGMAQDQREATQAPAELPRLLKHPYVLRLLALKPSLDGYIEPVDASATLATAGLGGRIDIQEELDAQRAMGRRGDADAFDEGGNAGGAGGAEAGAGGGGGEEGPDSEETEEEAAAGGAEDDFGFF